MTDDKWAEPLSKGNCPFYDMGSRDRPVNITSEMRDAGFWAVEDALDQGASHSEIAEAAYTAMELQRRARRKDNRREAKHLSYVFNNPTFDHAAEELLRHLETHEPPEIVRLRAIDVLQNPTKLLCWVGDAVPGRTPRVQPGLYATDLFVKLLAACRALDWEVVGVILEQAISPPRTEAPTGPGEVQRARAAKATAE